MSLSSPQQTEIEKPVTRLVNLVQLYFITGVSPHVTPVYFCTMNHDISWNSITWKGLGELIKISAVEESAGTVSSGLSFTLNIAQASLLAMAVGPVEEYRGSDAKMYFCPVDEQFRIIDTPQLCWRGIMDTVAIGIDKEQGSIVIKCETSAYGLKRRTPMRINAAQQKQKYPTDTGLDYLTSLLAQPQLWLSRRFQQMR